jgi:(p)ppGpp synthase/HD superfamily hydrolase
MLTLICKSEVFALHIIEKALQLAAKAHEGQYRKQSRIPYITHPVAVGMILMKAGYEEIIIAAGILHDSVEDTELTLAQLHNAFGLRIASIVEGCSEPDKSLPWETRKKHSIEFLKTASEEIRAVACADKLHNIRSIIADYNQDGDRVWQKFNRGKTQQEWYYRRIIESLGHVSRFPLLEELRVEADRLFS